MDLVVVQELNKKELWQRLDIACPPDSSSRGWTEKVVRIVSRTCSRWVVAEVPGPELAEIVIPWRCSGADNKYDVVPREGQQLKAVSIELDTRIRSKAPEFYKRIESLLDLPLGQIFLSQVLPHEDDTYADVQLKAGQFTTLDGLHRLIAASKRGLLADSVQVVAALE